MYVYLEEFRGKKGKLCKYIIISKIKEIPEVYLYWKDLLTIKIKIQ